MRLSVLEPAAELPAVASFGCRGRFRDRASSPHGRQLRASARGRAAIRPRNADHPRKSGCRCVPCEIGGRRKAIGEVPLRSARARAARASACRVWPMQVLAEGETFLFVYVARWASRLRSRDDRGGNWFARPAGTETRADLAVAPR